MSRQQVNRRAAPKRKRPALTTRNTKKSPTEKALADSRRVEPNIAEVQRCFNLGMEIHNACLLDEQPRMLRQQAHLYKIPVNTARRYRQFAQTYTQRELDILYRRFRADQFALSVTHFFVLLGVDDKSLRKMMAIDAVQQNLSVRGLWKLKRANIRTPGTSGGRKPDVVKMRSKKELRVAINLETARWLRWLDMLLGSDPKVDEVLKLSLQDLRTHVHKVEQLSSRQRVPPKTPRAS